MNHFRLQRGATLVELIISIVVLGIGLAGILLVMNRNTATSSDPLVLHQGIAIAEAYLEEILDKPFVDPNVDGEINRADYDDIDDYAAIVNQVPQDQLGNPIAGLGNYLVTVTVVNEAVGPAGNQAPAGQTYRVSVAVTPPAGSVIQVSAYRTNF